jgi:NTP pyrophosphatase (non-canonical NTP hydrolase)
MTAMSSLDGLNQHHDQICDVIKVAQRLAWSIAANAGFHDTARRTTPLERLALIASEVGEAISAYQRNGKPSGFYTEVDGKPEGIDVELADVVIRILDYAEEEGIDLGAVLVHKMAYNARRPYRHGKVL